MSSFDSLVSRRVVIATIKVPGFHAWLNAPPPVEYLGQEHRHVFTIRCEVEVRHGDRDVEFHMLQGWMRDATKDAFGLRGDHDIHFGGRSCETIATELHLQLFEAGIHCSAIEVWEDDENGARVEFTNIEVR